MTLITVVPAQAETRKPVSSGTVLWVPACAGATGLVYPSYLSFNDRLKVDHE